MRLCARCGVREDEHPSPTAVTDHWPHAFVPWCSAWNRRCRATHGGWECRCDLPYAHEGTHLAERGMDKPEWVEQTMVDGRPA